METNGNPRIVQGMLIANYVGDGAAHSIQMFRIPASERVAFRTFLAEKEPALLSALGCHKFVKLRSKRQMARVAEAFRELRPKTRVGWVTVPMRANSIVLWTGAHRVQGAKRKKDKESYRSVLYLRLQRKPSPLPQTWSPNSTRSDIQGKSINHAIEDAYGSWIVAKGQSYGWSQKTIPAGTPGFYQSANVKERDPDAWNRLMEDGYLVMNDVLTPSTATKLHGAITDILRTILFEIPRQGMSQSVRKYVRDLPPGQFEKIVNEPRLKKARYFKHRSTALWCDYDAEDNRRMRALQGVPGYTLSSQMIDIQEAPAFSCALAEAHPAICRVLGTVYFGKERCSLRSFGAAHLETHIDEPVF